MRSQVLRKECDPILPAAALVSHGRDPAARDIDAVLPVSDIWMPAPFLRCSCECEVVGVIVVRTNDAPRLAKLEVERVHRSAFASFGGQANCAPATGPLLGAPEPCVSVGLGRVQAKSPRTACRRGAISGRALSDPSRPLAHGTHSGAWDGPSALGFKPIKLVSLPALPGGCRRHSNRATFAGRFREPGDRPAVPARAY